MVFSKAMRRSIEIGNVQNDIIIDEEDMSNLEHNLQFALKEFFLLPKAIQHKYHVFLLFSHAQEHPLIKKAAEMSAVSPRTVQNCLPPFLYFSFEGTRLFISYERGVAPVLIGDLERSFPFTPLPFWKSWSNADVTTVSQGARLQILLTGSSTFLRYFYSSTRIPSDPRWEQCVSSYFYQDLPRNPGAQRTAQNGEE
jgi:hypothetical protein